MTMILKLFASVAVGFVVGLGALFGVPHDAQPLSGAFSPSGGGTYRLGQSIGTSDTSFKLSSFKEPVSNIPYTMSYLGSDIGYGTVSPQSSVSEFISFTGITQNTDGSALLTGVSRGVSRTPGSGGCVASTTLAQSHAGQSIFILSNQPCFYVNEYVALRTVSSSTAATVISSTTPWHYDSVGAQANGSAISTTSEFASVAYVNAVSFAGTSNASLTVKGIVELATGAQAGSSTPTDSTGASLALYSVIATSSPYTAASVVPVTQSNGKLKQMFLDLTENFNFTGTTLIKTLSASSTAANPLTLNGLTYSFPTVRASSSTVLMENGSGAVSWGRPDFGLISSTTLSAAVASTTVSSIPAAGDLTIYIDIPPASQVAGELVHVQFNADTGNDYDWQLVDMGPTASGGQSKNVIRVSSTPGAASMGQYITLNITNRARYHGILTRSVNVGDVSAGGGTSGTAQWSGVVPISSITIGSTSNLPIGTNIRIYGSSN